MRNLNTKSYVLKISDDSSDDDVKRDFEKLVFEIEDLYPGIDLWYKRQVVPGLSDGSRLGYIAYIAERPVAGVVIRLSNRAKICSLRVLPEAQGIGIGSALFGLAAQEISKLYNEFHFTAPESLVEEKAEYFSRIGFHYAGEVNRYYRPGEGEYAFVGNTTDVIKKTEELLSYTLFGVKVNVGKEANPLLLMSIKPKYAQRIMEGGKRIELRRRFSHHHKNSYMLIYSSSPQQALLGFARIKDAVKIPVSMVSSDLLDQVGCDAAEVCDYAGVSDSLWALMLTDIQPFSEPISRRALEDSLNTSLRPPMSYENIKRGTPWGKVAYYLMKNLITDPPVQFESEIQETHEGIIDQQLLWT